MPIRETVGSLRSPAIISGGGTAEFDVEATRRLVADDPFLAYTVVRHIGEAEDHWLQQVFKLEVCSDPGLCTRYRSLLRRGRAHSQPVRG
jgi:hypothetical protein